MNFKISIPILALILFSGISINLFAQNVSGKEAIFVNITSGESLKMIKANLKNRNFLILDVRTPEEFQEKHIKGAVNIDFYKEDYQARLKQLNKSRKILIYCRSGRRSGESLPVMKKLGFKEVYNMSGGLNEWEANGFPFVKSE